jgi:hypothetical protein
MMGAVRGGKRVKAVALAVIIVFLLGALAGCAAGSNDLVNTNGAKGSVAGFWLGLWHGIISPVTFVISLFNKSVQMYEVHNNGGWYNLGFLFGVIAIFGGGGGGAGRRWRR